MVNNYKPNTKTDGRIIMVDPNPVDNNLVPLEELNILVELSVQKKNRSVINIDSSNTGGTITDTGSGTVNISFLEGTKYGSGGSTLTTNYTDINPLTSKLGTNSEGLGITNIDIEFNSSFAPMITVSMVDIRGSTIFAAGNKSRYNVFFHLPYPIFKLKIKGFYGKAVTYCLHLTKFTSKFNAKTGNFEITCKFIGYTYAFLTDMLMGYLRAITETDKGKALLELKGKYAGKTYITLDKFMAKAGTLNSKISQLKKNDDNVNKSVGLTSAISKLGELSALIEQLASSDLTTSVLGHGNSKYFGKTSTGIYGVVFNPNIIGTKNETNLNNRINEYNTAVGDIITDFNNLLSPLNTYKLVADDFKLLAPKEAWYIKIKSDKPYLKVLESSRTVYPTGSNLLDADNIKYYDIGPGIKKITTLKSELTIELKKVKDTIAKYLLNTITTELGFRPTIKNIIELLTVHAEILVERIKEVSKSAEEVSNLTRKDALTSYFSDLDIKGDKSTIYAFPKYSEAGEEVWIGGNPDLANIDEVKFIEELLIGLSKVSKSDEAYKSEIDSTSSGWFSVNPLDSSFGNVFENPYLQKDIQSTKNEDSIFRYILMRATTLLGYSNKYISTEDIALLGELEANNIFNNLDKNIIPLLVEFGKTTTTTTDFNIVADNVINKFTKINNNNIESYSGNKLMFNQEDSGGSTYLFYYYIIGNHDLTKILPFRNDSITFLPIYTDTQTDEFYNGKVFYSSKTSLKYNSELNDMNSSNEYLYFGNHYLGYPNTTINYNYSSYWPRPLDGATYIKIITVDDFNKNITSNPSYFETVVKNNANSNVDSKNVITVNNLNNNIVGKNSGYNIIGYGQSVNNQTFFTCIPNPTSTSKPASVKYLFYSYGYREIYKSLEDNTITDYQSIVEKYNNVAFGLGFAPTDLNTTKDLIGNSLSYQVVCQQWDQYKYGNKVNIFCSKLYWAQRNIVNENDRRKARAFLFLNTIPFNGLRGSVSHNLKNCENDNRSVKEIIDGKEDVLGVFSQPMIRGLFAERAGFILSPYSWVLLIGSLLWRNDTYAKNSADPIEWKIDGTVIIPTLMGNDIQLPAKDQYFKVLNTDVDFIDCSMAFPKYEYDTYGYIERAIITMPSQARAAFLKEFEDWASSGEGFKKIQDELELFDFDDVNFNSLTIWNNIWKNLRNSSDNIDDFTTANFSDGSYTISADRLSKIKSNYLEINLYTIDGIDDILNLLGSEYSIRYLNDEKNENGYTKLTNFLIEERVIVNSTWRIWNNRLDDATFGNDSLQTDSSAKGRYLLYFLRRDLKSYLSSMLSSLDKLNNSDSALLSKAKENTIDEFLSDEKIKLNTYRNIKAINDKWIAGNGDSIINICGPIASRRDRLIDTFKFLNKNFEDIGDKLIINPLALSTNIFDNINQSLYSVLSRLLTDNNMDFIPLPAYVDFKDATELGKAFEAYPYSKIGANSAIGPSFICMYIGDRSSKLNLGDSEYEDDGQQFSLDPAVNLSSGVNDSADGNPVPVILVHYGDENQSMFSNVELDQEEFTETDESLKIIDDISQKGDEKNRAFVSQSLFNVWSVRSYSCSVESLGNACIQPMMYFQLNNIPMFNGAYMIIKATHNIKPNFMTTTFKGVRIKKINTPLIDVETVFTSLLGTLTAADVITVKKLTFSGVYDNVDDMVTGSDAADFIKKTKEIAIQLGISDYRILILHMYAESRLNSKGENSNGGAVGLIQWFPGGGLTQLTNFLKNDIINITTEKKYGIDKKRKKLTDIDTSTFLKNMTRVEQLDYVKNYFEVNIKAADKIPPKNFYESHALGWGLSCYINRNKDEFAYYVVGKTAKASDFVNNGWDKYSDSKRMTQANFKQLEAGLIASFLKKSLAETFIKTWLPNYVAP